MKTAPESSQSPTFSDQRCAAMEKWIAGCAASTTESGAFLREVANRLRSETHAGLVALIGSDWAQPVMVISDDSLARLIDRSALSSSLATSSTNPMACNLPIQLESANDIESTAGIDAQGIPSARAIQGRWGSEHFGAAVVLVYPLGQLPDAQRQLEDLKLFRSAGGAVETSLSKFQQAGDPQPGEFPAGLAGRTAQELSPPGTVADNNKPTNRIASFQSFHLDLDIEKTAARIANESRRMIQADRVSVFTPVSSGLFGQRTFRVRAVSGVAVVDRRSNSIRQLEHLAQVSSVFGRPVSYPLRKTPGSASQNETGMPPQFEDAAEAYFDESGVAEIEFVPLFQPTADPGEQDSIDPDDSPGIENMDATRGQGEPLAILAIESFRQTNANTAGTMAGDESQALIPHQETRSLFGASPSGVPTIHRAIAGESMLAIRNALQHSQATSFPLTKPLSAVSRSAHRWKYLLGLLTLIGLAVAACLVEVDHYVVATGSLRPSASREVFTAVDGVVGEILVSDGQLVQKDDVLIKIDSPDLEANVEALSGKLATANERLAAIKKLRLGGRVSQDKLNSMVIQQKEVESELIDLQTQLEIAQRQLDQLEVRAPMTGKVSAWQINRRLLGRPIRVGDHLMTLVDPDSVWELHLAIPDLDAGPVMESWSASDSDDQDAPRMPVRFVVATVPDQTFDATLTELSRAARQNELGENVLDARADAMGLNQEQIQPGVDVTARIRCDRRSIASSWFGDVADFYHRHIGFHLDRLISGDDE